MSAGSHILLEATYRQLLDQPPNVAVLPWGATEAHNYHLPHGTDVIEADRIARESARLAAESGGRPIVLPVIPFGNDEQQLDQVATISITTTTAHALLNDVVRSLKEQGIRRLLILNGHGGNEFKPMVRDLQQRHRSLIVVVNFWQVCPGQRDGIFDDPGDHAGDLETSLLLHLCPELVELSEAGTGTRNPFTIEGLNQPGVWTPRPWSQTHPDTGCGDPSAATAEKGRRYFEAVCRSVAELIVNLSGAGPNDLPPAP